MSINELSALLIVLFTFITTAANILLWLTTRQTVTILMEQVQHQIANSYSQAQSNIIDGHRELFLGILNNPSLLENFAKANNLDPNTWQLEKIAEFLINQVLIGYLNFSTGIISQSHFEGFKRDARNVFAYESVRKHWQRVKVVHAPNFRRFVETELLCDSVKSA